MASDTIPLLNWINQNNGLLTLLFSFIVTLSTVVYAYLTWKLVVETKKMRETQTEPKVIIRIDPREDWLNFIDLSIQNIGSGTAHNISFEIDTVNSTNPSSSLIKELYEINFIKKGIGFLPPGKRISTFYTSMVEGFEDKGKSVLSVKVSYRSETGTEYNETFLLNFVEFVGMKQLGKPPAYEIAEYLKKISETISNLSSSKRLKIDIYDKEDRSDEQKHFEKMRKQAANLPEKVHITAPLKPKCEMDEK